MDKITVCIEIDGQGQITVGAEPLDTDGAAAGVAPTLGMTDMSTMGGERAGDGQADEAAEKSYMQPVKSIDEALGVARDLLSNAGQVGPAMEQDAAAKAFATNRGYKGPQNV